MAALQVKSGHGSESYPVKKGRAAFVGAAIDPWALANDVETVADPRAGRKGRIGGYSAGLTGWGGGRR